MEWSAHIYLSLQKLYIKGLMIYKRENQILRNSGIQSKMEKKDPAMCCLMLLIEHGGFVMFVVMSGLPQSIIEQMEKGVRFAREESARIKEKRKDN